MFFNNYPIEIYLLIGGALLLLSIMASKVSDRLGIPALLLFLVVGMLAGSEGIGGIHFDDPWMTQMVGVVALVFILFSGGLETKIEDIKPVLVPGIILSTVGVFLTAAAVGLFAQHAFHIPFLQGFLLGAVVSSTDAATVLTVLRSRKVSLKGRLRSLLELESGSNDPMAVFLTLGAIRLLMEKDFTVTALIPQLFIEIVVGVAMAWIMTKVVLYVINRVQLAYEGLYPVLTLALAVLVYALTTVCKGNGFLAVYLMGLFLGNSSFVNKKTLLNFHEGLAWLMQIVMFLALGLLVFPSQVASVAYQGLLVSLFLMFIARPAGVFVCLAFSGLGFREKLMVSWVGLRGAVPIILALFPLMAGVPGAKIIFDVVFFIVLTSVLFQGTSIPFVSRFLKLDEPLKTKRLYPIEFQEVLGADMSLEEIIVPYNSTAAGKRLYEIGIPDGCLIVLICRNEQFLLPNGNVPIEGGDVLLVLLSKQDASKLNALLKSDK